MHTGITSVAANIKAIEFHQPSFPTSYAWDYREDNEVGYDFRAELNFKSSFLNDTS